MLNKTDNYISLQKKILSPNIKLLGDILGEVLIEQSSREKFELEEKIRLLAKKFREEKDKISFKKLQDIINQLNSEEYTIITRAFSHYFNLVNLAEEYYKIQINRIRSSAPHKTNTFNFTFKRIKELNMDIEKILEILDNIQIQLIWTAHPTEARRLTILVKLREVYNLLHKMQNFEENSIEYRKSRDLLKETITLLWQSDELREEELELLDEVRTALFYFDNSLFNVIPDIYEELTLKIKEETRIEHLSMVDLPKFCGFGSWIGGDRDGHPGVTASVTIQTLLLHKRMCLRKYLKSVEQLIQHISSSTNIVNVTEELEKSILSNENEFKDFALQTQKLNKSEPYRRKLDFIRLKLENSLQKVEESAENVGLGRTLVGYSQSDMGPVTNYYKESTDLLQDLFILYRSLKENNGEIIAEGKLARLIVQLQVFSFHLAPLDLRQDSEVHLNVLKEVFEIVGLENLNQLSKKQQSQVFERELINPRPLGMRKILADLSQTSQELFNTLEVAMDSIQTISRHSITSYIISMTTHDRDLFALMLLMKEVGLIEIEKGVVKNAYVDVVPLFETRKDLQNAGEVISRMYKNKLYRSLIDHRESTQEIMIGYSDSTKDVGIFESNYQLLKAQEQFIEISENEGVKIRIFHGRGGSISRGGGPTNRAILSQPPGSSQNIKITEQGEVIGQNYSNPEIAYNHLEGILSAMILRGFTDTYLENQNNPAYIKQEYLEKFGEISNFARKRYEELVKENPTFIKFYMQFTPLDLIERATIGSRPSRRTKDSISGIDSLRAIPWVFSWMQTRLIFPAYYGIGYALHHFEKEYGINTIRQIYREWPYFESIINNIQMVMLKVDLDVAQLYLNMVNTDLHSIFEDIKAEYNTARSQILGLTNSEELLDHLKDVQISIKRRNPYIDPLSIIQVTLLKQWRKKNRPDDLKTGSLLRVLLQTVNGVASGLKNTG